MTRIHRRTHFRSRLIITWLLLGFGCAHISFTQHFPFGSSSGFRYGRLTCRIFFFADKIRLHLGISNLFRYFSPERKTSKSIWAHSKPFRFAQRKYLPNTFSVRDLIVSKIFKELMVTTAPNNSLRLTYDSMANTSFMRNCCSARFQCPVGDFTLASNRSVSFFQSKEQYERQ